MTFESTEEQRDTTHVETTEGGDVNVGETPESSPVEEGTPQPETPKPGEDQGDDAGNGDTGDDSGE